MSPANLIRVQEGFLHANSVNRSEKVLLLFGRNQNELLTIQFLLFILCLFRAIQYTSKICEEKYGTRVNKWHDFAIKHSEKEFFEN